MVSSDETSEKLREMRRIENCSSYYEIFGVSKSVSGNILKRKFRELSLKFHPDKNKLEGSTRVYQVILKAYEVLSNPIKKSAYDEQLRVKAFAEAYRNSFSETKARNRPAKKKNPEKGQRKKQKEQQRKNSSSSDESDHKSKEPEKDTTNNFLHSQQFILLLYMTVGLILLSIWSMGLYNLEPEKTTHSEVPPSMPLKGRTSLRNPVFKETWSNIYSAERTTRVMQFKYYVQHDFDDVFLGNIRKLEKRIEKEIIEKLVSDCSYEKQKKTDKIILAQNKGSMSDEAIVKSIKTPSCDRLNNLLVMGYDWRPYLKEIAQ